MKHISIVYRNKKTVCLVDLTGQDRLLPGLGQKPTSIEEEHIEDGSMPWKVGFAETSGVRNKLVPTVGEIQ